MRLGVFGGSFNPPHVGHYLIASDAFEALALDKLLIVPAAANPHKGHDVGAPAADRLQMAKLAFEGDPRFEVSSMEIERGGLSYTVDTLEALASKHAGAELVLLMGMDAALASKHAGAELVLLMGMDALRTLDTWKRPERIRELARLAVLTRGGDSGSLPKDVDAVTTRRIDVSSTEIRDRIAAGKPIRGFVSKSVESFISAAKLYAGNRNA